MSTSPQRTAPASVPTHSSQATNLKRRRFLLTLGAGGAGAAAVATQAFAAPLVEAAGPGATEASKGNHETEHIRDYSATTRI
jgi:hypothetical protein